MALLYRLLAAISRWRCFVGWGDNQRMSARCETCKLPVSLSKTRRELLYRVATGKWYVGPDADIGRLQALERDGLVFWREPSWDGSVHEGYFITERGRELLNQRAG